MPPTPNRRDSKVGCACATILRSDKLLARGARKVTTWITGLWELDIGAWQVDMADERIREACLRNSGTPAEFEPKARHFFFPKGGAVQHLRNP